MRLVDFIIHFPDEDSCKEHFRKQRELQGVKCKRCNGLDHYWLSSKEMYQCKNNSCRFRTSLKSGTVMENSKLTFHCWYMAMNLMTSPKNSLSALEVQRQLGLKNYEPVFEMMHKIRLIMGKRGDEYVLEGFAEIDEGYFSNSKQLEINKFTGEQESLKRGKGSQKKTVAQVMHSYTFPEKQGLLVKKKHKHSTIPKFVKIKIIENESSTEMNKNLEQFIDPITNIISDDHKSYKDVKSKFKSHTKNNTEKVEITKVLPWVHKTITNVKGILMNVHKGVSEQYMQNYMNEYCYKFNRRSFGVNIFERLMIVAVALTWY